MKCLLLNGCAGTLFALVAASSPGLAEERHLIEDSLALSQGKLNETVSLSETIRRVQRATGGLILGAERVSYDGQNINRVKFLDGNGHVRYVDEPTSARPEDPPPIQPNSSPRRRDHH